METLDGHMVTTKYPTFDNMSPTKELHTSPLVAQKKMDNKCVQTTKGWVCALCFPLGHPSRALERVLGLTELKAHATGHHFATLKQDEWENYVNKSVYYEAQFRNQSHIGLSDGVMHGPPTIASQKTLANKAGVFKRKYVKKVKDASESAVDLMESMIHFGGRAKTTDVLETPASPMYSQDEDSEMSDVESAPATIHDDEPFLYDTPSAYGQYGMHPMGVPQVTASPSSLTNGTGHFYDPFDGSLAGQNQFGTHSKHSHQGLANPADYQTGNGPYCDQSTTSFSMHPNSVSQVGASPTTSQSAIGSLNNLSIHHQFDTHLLGAPQTVALPSTPSRKKGSATKNPLRQRLSENPSFESAVAIHGLAKVQAAGNAGLQRYLERQARGLPRTANASLPLAVSPLRNSTMDLPLTAANYAAAGMPKLHVEKAARRTKKIERRRQVSAPIRMTDDADDNVSTSTNAAISTSLNKFGVPVALFGQAPGFATKSHTYKSIYAEMTPKKQLPLPELSFPELTLSDFSTPAADNNVVTEEQDCQIGAFSMPDNSQDTEITDPFVLSLLNEDFGADNTMSQAKDEHFHGGMFHTSESNQLFNEMGPDNMYDSLKSDSCPSGADFNFNDGSTMVNKVSKQNIAIPEDNPTVGDSAAQQDNFNFDDWLAEAGIPRRDNSNIDDMFNLDNSSNPSNNNDFQIFSVTSLDYGDAGRQALEDIHAQIAARQSSPPSDSTDSSTVIGSSSPVVEDVPDFVESSPVAESSVSNEMTAPATPVPAAVTPEMAAIMATLKEQQDLLAAMAKRQEEQEARHEAELAKQKAETARREAELNALQGAEIARRNAETKAQSKTDSRLRKALQQMEAEALEPQVEDQEDGAESRQQGEKDKAKRLRKQISREKAFERVKAAKQQVKEQKDLHRTELQSLVKESKTDALRKKISREKPIEYAKALSPGMKEKEDLLRAKLLEDQETAHAEKLRKQMSRENALSPPSAGKFVVDPKGSAYDGRRRDALLNSPTTPTPASRKRASSSMEDSSPIPDRQRAESPEEPIRAPNPERASKKRGASSMAAMADLDSAPAPKRRVVAPAPAARNRQTAPAARGRQLPDPDNISINVFGNNTTRPKRQSRKPKNEAKLDTVPPQRLFIPTGKGESKWINLSDIPTRRMVQDGRGGLAYADEMTVSSEESKPKKVAKKPGTSVGNALGLSGPLPAALQNLKRSSS